LNKLLLLLHTICDYLIVAAQQIQLLVQRREGASIAAFQLVAPQHQRRCHATILACERFGLEVNGVDSLTRWQLQGRKAAKYASVSSGTLAAAQYNQGTCSHLGIRCHGIQVIENCFNRTRILAQGFDIIIVL
jgi:hypothetical protein